MSNSHILKIIAACIAAGSVQGFAQDYPSKPVRAIITFTAGSSTDIVGRVVTQKLSEYWGQPVLVENRGGAGGSIAAAIVAKAAPDGYTLLIDSSAHAVTPAIYAKLPYDTLKDFVDIAPLAEPGVREQLAKPGNDTMSMTPAEFGRFVRREIEDYGKVIKAAGIKPQ